MLLRLPRIFFLRVLRSLQLSWSVVNTNIFCRYEESEEAEKKGDHNPRTFVFIVKQLISTKKLNHSTKLTAQIVTALVCCYGKTHYYFYKCWPILLCLIYIIKFFAVVLCICTATLLSIYMTEIIAGKVTFIVPLVILIIALVITLSFIYFQPVSSKKLAFSVWYMFLLQFFC